MLLGKFDNIDQKQSTRQTASRQHGRTVLRLPVAQCELNPTELTWAFPRATTYLNIHVKYYLTKVGGSTLEGFQHITADIWTKVCKYVPDIKSYYLELDEIIFKHENPLPPI